MKCLYCDCTESKVIDSRSADDDKTIRRRRECECCLQSLYHLLLHTDICAPDNGGNRHGLLLAKEVWPEARE